MADIEKARFPFRSDSSEKVKTMGVTVEEIEAGQEQERNLGVSRPPLHHHSRSWHRGPTVPELEDWHHEKEMQLSKWDKVKIILINVVFLLFPILYLGMGAAIAAMDGHKLFSDKSGVIADLLDVQDPVNYIINQVLKVSVTIFPIAFGIILCKTLKSAALFKAERGTKLITLEQLMASKSFGSAALAPMNFKRLDKTAIFLFVLWVMSPFTTQCLQRVFKIAPQVYGTEEKTLHYMNTMNWNLSTVSYQTSSISAQAEWSAMFQAQLLQPRDDGSVQTDVFGNPKIPLLESLPNYVKDAQNFSEIGVTKNFDGTLKNNFKWSSSVGIPIAGLPLNTTSYTTKADFELRSSYWTFDCSDWTHLNNENELMKVYDDLRHVEGDPGAHYFFPNNVDVDGWEYNGKDWSFFLGLERGSDGLVNRIKFGSKTNFKNEPTKFALTTCNIEQVAVVSKVRCLGKSCRVTGTKRDWSPPAHMRPFNLDYANLAYAFAWYNPDANVVAATSNTKGQLQKGTDKGNGPIGSSFLEKWLINPKTATQKNTRLGFVDVSYVNITAFSERFAYVWTTFAQIALGPAMISAQLPESFVYDPADYKDRNNYKETTSEVQYQYIAYQCSWGWLAGLVVSCIIVVLVVVANLYMQLNTLAPDILGYISTMTHNNQFVPLPRGGNTLDGVDRTIKLADLKVRLHDVAPGGDVGHIALATVEGERLQRGRRYQ